MLRASAERSGHCHRDISVRRESATASSRAAILIAALDQGTEETQCLVAIGPGPRESIRTNIAVGGAKPTRTPAPPTLGAALLLSLSIGIANGAINAAVCWRSAGTYQDGRRGGFASLDDASTCRNKSSWASEYSCIESSMERNLGSGLSVTFRVIVGTETRGPRAAIPSNSAGGVRPRVRGKRTEPCLRDSPDIAARFPAMPT